MPAPHLLIRKRMLLIQGKVRPCCYVQAIVAPEIRATLDEHFLAETLFRRSAYSAAWPKGALALPPAIAPAVSAFLKNDACPEISVKTLVAGQMHQGANVWEMMSFEFIAKLAFENFVALTESVAELGRDVIYASQTSSGVARDVAAFNADMAAELQESIAADLAA